MAGVWLGNDDSSPTKRASGANLPVDIWSRFMREALRNTPPAPLPGSPWRDPGALAQAAAPSPPAELAATVSAPAPAAPAPVAPAPVTRQPTAATPQAPAQAQTPPRAPRREQGVEQTNDLLPPAGIPRGQPKTGIERLFGG